MDINLCSIVIEEMRKMGFQDKSVNRINGDHGFVMAFDKEMTVQRTYLTMLFHRVFMESKLNSAVPRNVRIALNIAVGSEGWLDDVKLVILPFLKENESTFF